MTLGKDPTPDPQYRTEEGIWWCNSHGRAATHVKPDGDHCCAPRLGGIMIPCFTVFAPMTVEPS